MSIVHGTYLQDVELALPNGILPTPTRNGDRTKKQSTWEINGTFAKPGQYVGFAFILVQDQFR